MGGVNITNINLTNVKQQRLAKGKTQSQLAELLGITQEAYSNKECGKRLFTIEEAKKIADYLGITVDELFF